MLLRRRKHVVHGQQLWHSCAFLKRQVLFPDRLCFGPTGHAFPSECLSSSATQLNFQVVMWMLRINVKFLNMSHLEVWILSPSLHSQAQSLQILPFLSAPPSSATSSRLTAWNFICTLGTPNFYSQHKPESSPSDSQNSSVNISISYLKTLDTVLCCYSLVAS